MLTVHTAERADEEVAVADAPLGQFSLVAAARRRDVLEAGNPGPSPGVNVAARDEPGAGGLVSVAAARILVYQRCWMTAREREAAELPSLRTHPARRMSQQSAEAGGCWSGCGVSESDVHVSGCSKIRWPFHVS